MKLLPAEGLLGCVLAADRAAARRRRGAAAGRPAHRPLGPPARDAPPWSPPSSSAVLLHRPAGRAGGAGGRRRPVHLHLRPATLDVRAGLLYDPLSAVFVLLITGVGSLIHIYSIGYMAHDAGRRRFFAYLNLFVAAMLLLVLGNSFVALYVGWEGVGLASYLLIAFWYTRPAAATAAKKAFIMNRVGDVGLALAIFVMFAQLGTTDYDGVFGAVGTAGRRHGHRDRAAAAARRVRQVRPVPAAGLAARRHGGPDPGLGAHPRRDHGHRRRLPDRPLRADLRRDADRAHRRPRRRRGHPADRGDHRLRVRRHQEGAGLLDGQPDRLHVPGRRASARPATSPASRTCSRTASSRPGCSSAPARSCTP